MEDFVLIPCTLAEETATRANSGQAATRGALQTAKAAFAQGIAPTPSAPPVPAPDDIDDSIDEATKKTSAQRWAAFVPFFLDLALTPCDAPNGRLCEKKSSSIGVAPRAKITEAAIDFTKRTSSSYPEDIRIHTGRAAENNTHNTTGRLCRLTIPVHMTRYVVVGLEDPFSKWCTLATDIADRCVAPAPQRISWRRPVQLENNELRKWPPIRLNPSGKSSPTQICASVPHCPPLQATSSQCERVAVIPSSASRHAAP